MNPEDQRLLQIAAIAIDGMTSIGTHLMAQFLLDHVRENEAMHPLALMIDALEAWASVHRNGVDTSEFNPPVVTDSQGFPADLFPDQE